MRIKHKNTDPIPSAEEQMKSLGVLTDYDPPTQKAVIEMSKQVCFTDLLCLDYSV